MPKRLPAPCSVKTLKSIINYDCKTGIFTWTKSKSSRVKIGQEAGWLHYNKTTDSFYLRIEINGKGYYAHKLAWYYMTGEWIETDHINRITEDNKFKNLRAASRESNMRNRVLKNKHGYKGVSRLSTGNKHYQASITVNRKRIHLGTFETPELAYKEYCKAAKRYHKKFANLECTKEANNVKY